MTSFVARENLIPHLLLFDSDLTFVIILIVARFLMVFDALVSFGYY
jgi:hypothetical protein